MISITAAHASLYKFSSTHMFSFERTRSPLNVQNAFATNSSRAADVRCRTKHQEMLLACSVVVMPPLAFPLSLTWVHDLTASLGPLCTCVDPHAATNAASLCITASRLAPTNRRAFSNSSSLTGPRRYVTRLFIISISSCVDSLHRSRDNKL